MKKILYFIILVMLAGLLLSCVSPVDPDKMNIDSYTGLTVVPFGSFYNPGLSRFTDEDAGVVCYVYYYSGGGGIDCLPISETKLERNK